MGRLNKSKTRRDWKIKDRETEEGDIISCDPETGKVYKPQFSAWAKAHAPYLIHYNKNASLRQLEE